MDFFHFDKDNNLVTISNAILEHFEITPFHNPHTQLREILSSKPYQKIIVFLFDGLGKSIRELHLREKDFLRRNEKFVISSVFPPTTVAATTAFLSGKYPCQTSWLGWDQYFPQHDVTVDMFTNAESFTKEIIKGPHLAKTYCPYSSIIELINEKNKYKASIVQPSFIDPNGAQSFEDFFSLCAQKFNKEGNNFVYAYWADPDGLIHKYGTSHPLVKRCCKDINKKVKEFVRKNSDVLTIVLADHSLVDTSFLYVGEHKDFVNCINHNFSLDSRSCLFYVDESKREDFVKAYNKYYQKDFILLTKQEIIDEHMFGYGEEHHLFRDFLGDYMLTSISNKGFSYTLDCPMIGAHSGSLEEESLISVSIFNL
ncbi:MAG: alkaline phosphatase family protein [Bacilli bacterium]